MTMTPAIRFLKNTAVSFQVYEYSHDPRVSSFGKEAASALGISEDDIFKTLVLQAETELFVVLVPVSSRADFKTTAKILGVKKVSMAEAQKVQRVTGYVLGGVSPLGQKKLLPTYIDLCAQEKTCIYVSAGRRGVQVALNPLDLACLLKAHFVSLSVFGRDL